LCADEEAKEDAIEDSMSEEGSFGDAAVGKADDPSPPGVRACPNRLQRTMAVECEDANMGHALLQGELCFALHVHLPVQCKVVYMVVLGRALNACIPSCMHPNHALIMHAVI
jgi:hypothetical protein